MKSQIKKQKKKNEWTENDTDMIRIHSYNV